MRICKVCGSVVMGRTDKKFCSVKCKSIHQYESRQKNEKFYLRVDKQLKVNRKILKRYNASGYTTIRCEELFEAGFDPNFFTHYWKNQKGDVYLFVYDYGFLSRNGKTHSVKGVKPNKYIIVKWQSYMEKK